MKHAVNLSVCGGNPKLQICCDFVKTKHAMISLLSFFAHSAGSCYKSKTRSDVPPSIFLFLNPKPVIIPILFFDKTSIHSVPISEHFPKLNFIKNFSKTLLFFIKSAFSKYCHRMNRHSYTRTGATNYY